MLYPQIIVDKYLIKPSPTSLSPAFGSNRSSGPFGVSSAAPPASAFNSASFQFGQANNTQQNNTSSGAGVFQFGQSYTNNVSTFRLCSQAIVECLAYFIEFCFDFPCIKVINN